MEAAIANEHYKDVTTLRLLVRDQLDELSASFWSDAQILRYINRGKDRVWNRLKAVNEYYCTVTRTSNDGALTIQGESYNASSFRLVAGTSDYTLPPDFDQMSSVESISSGRENITFTRMNINDPEFRALRMLTDNQDPFDEIFFDILGEPAKIRIVPKVNVTLDLQITYVQTLPDLSAETDRLTLPNPLYQAVVDYAVSFALRQDRSPDALTYEQSGDKLIAEKFGSELRQTQDVQTARAFLEGW